MSWQKILSQGFASAQELLSFLELPLTLAHTEAEQLFKTRVPRGFAMRMRAQDAQDPLLLQVLASALELEHNPDFHADPLQEKKANPLPGLLHKYHGRVLLTLSTTCAINCRYCFRRTFSYEENNPGRRGWENAIAYIRKDSTIKEVILSGGDPLLVSDRVLTEVLQAIESIAHVEIVRFHTRIPIVLPERLTEAFLNLLKGTRLKKVIVLHCNHPNEINEAVKEACYLLKMANCHLLNQSVLLKQINDCPKILAALSYQLFDCGVLPYYLHVLDKVSGTAHFDIPLSQSQSIYRSLQAQVPGYLLPKLAQEQAHKPSKTLLASI